jgi:2-polyprenyl-3-methyl-5-hydroxy-6-metoxy-1,4-benzoquinol methylase
VLVKPALKRTHNRSNVSRVFFLGSSKQHAPHGVCDENVLCASKRLRQHPSTKVLSDSTLHRRCPLCESDEPQTRWSKPALRVVRCARCSMLYANPVAAELISGHFYGASSYHVSPEKLESDFAPVRFEREIKLLRRFCSRGAVLDVGCSTGAFLNALKVFGDAYQSTGMDVPGAAFDHARRVGISVIDAPFPEHDFGSEHFDAVTFWAVLEHLNRPRDFLTKAAEVLRPGGHCFVLVPNIRSLAMRLLGPRYRYVMPEHLNYFSRDTLLGFARTERRFQVRELGTTHFNPIVIWQDFRRGGLVPEEQRARLLKKTTAWKESSALRAFKPAYRIIERLLGGAGLADNLVLVLQRQA